MKFRPIPPPNVSEIRRIPKEIASEFSIKGMEEITPEILSSFRRRARQELDALHLCPHSARLKRKWVWGNPCTQETRRFLKDHVICEEAMCPQCVCSIWFASSLRPKPGEDFWSFLQGYCIGSSMRMGFQIFNR